MSMQTVSKVCPCHVKLAGVSGIKRNEHLIVYEKGELIIFRHLPTSL